MTVKGRGPWFALGRVGAGGMAAGHPVGATAEGVRPAPLRQFRLSRCRRGGRCPARTSAKPGASWADLVGWGRSFHAKGVGDASRDHFDDAGDVEDDCHGDREYQELNEAGDLACEQEEDRDDRHDH